MPEEAYSNDIWDYLEDMPYMPSREDRDALSEAAREDPTAAKRVRIWEYFFRIQPEHVGTPQKKEIYRIEERRRQTEKDINDLEAGVHDSQAGIAAWQRQQQNRGTLLLWLGGAIAAGAFILALVSGDSTPGMATSFLCCGSPGIVLLAAGLLLYRSPTGSPPRELTNALQYAQSELGDRRSELEALIVRSETRIPRLLAQVEELKKQIPAPPTDEQIHRWLQDDITSLTQQASERSGLLVRLVELKDAPNPLCILGPAELQRQERIPEPFLKHPDRRKHLKARRFSVLPDGSFEDFHGVYNLEFILVAEDMLGTYGTFFDFITGKTVGERTSEQYYHDVVAIRTKREYREVEIGDVRVPIDDAPTFSMSLSSGETREVTFASQSYFDGVAKQMGEASAEPFDVHKWVRNPEIAAENAIKALRARLRAHKGAPEDN